MNRTQLTHRTRKTVMPCLSKSFMLCFYDQLYSVISNSRLGFQHGTLRKYSMVTAVPSISDFIYRALDDQEIAYFAYVNIAKACNAVNPKLLLLKHINQLK
ncbi:hypothetical protein Tcan_00493, partial [Toxocara canis]